METAESMCNTNLEKKTKVKSYYAKRQKEYRMRKKIEKQQQQPKKIPKTNAQCQQQFRLNQKKILEHNEALNVARKKKNAERAKRYRDKLKAKKQRAELESLHSSKDDLLQPAAFNAIKQETDDRHDRNSQFQMRTNQIQPSSIKKEAQQEDSAQSENEIKVFCPKCDTEVSHTAEGIQEDQTKILIAKVYHYFEQEYEELKTIYGDLDLTPLSKFRQRTALATGVSETKVLEILKEEEGRNAVKRQEPPVNRRRARKRSKQTASSSEEGSSDDNADDNGESSNVNDEQMLVVKEEPTEYYTDEPEIFVSAAVKEEPSDIEVKKEQPETDPISLDVKTELLSDVVDDSTNETLALNEPAGTKRKARKISRQSDVTSTQQHTQGESSTTAAASNVRLTEQLDESSLFGDAEMKSEEIEIREEGFS